MPYHPYFYNMIMKEFTCDDHHVPNSYLFLCVQSHSFFKLNDTCHQYEKKNYFMFQIISCIFDPFLQIQSGADIKGILEHGWLVSILLVSTITIFNLDARRKFKI